MNLSEIETKLLMLAMDQAATEDEVAVAAKKFIKSLRTRFPSGVELIAAWGGGGRQQPKTMPMKPSYTRPFGEPDDLSGWQDILRTAQRFAQQRQQYQYQQYAQQQQSDARPASWKHREQSLHARESAWSGNPPIPTNA